MNYLIGKIWYRLKVATLTLPNIKDWQRMGLLLPIYTLVALPIGFYGGFLKFEPLAASDRTIIEIIAICFVTPAIAEELFFRVLLLPHFTEKFSRATQLIWAGLSLIAFIAYHPLNGLTFFPAGLETFNNPIFLLLAALLGIVCTLAYLSSGSLWTSVVLHWLVVITWLLLLGGYGLLNH
ncbi:MAG: CPBP family intramembrane metalloprotease [Cyanosarcina radialis HA8281-LM2]|nr:CPBP family intramembrane metalloprotease [Cyanosarcina radialis HA8281-LM2]